MNYFYPLDDSGCLLLSGFFSASNISKYSSSLFTCSLDNFDHSRTILFWIGSYNNGRGLSKASKTSGPNFSESSSKYLGRGLYPSLNHRLTVWTGTPKLSANSFWEGNGLPDSAASLTNSANFNLMYLWKAFMGFSSWIEWCLDGLDNYTRANLLASIELCLSQID